MSVPEGHEYCNRKGPSHSTSEMSIVSNFDKFFTAADTYSVLIIWVKSFVARTVTPSPSNVTVCVNAVAVVAKASCTTLIEIDGSGPHLTATEMWSLHQKLGKSREGIDTVVSV